MTKFQPDDPRMPAFLAAKDAWLENDTDWKNYRERIVRANTFDPPSPHMPWIAIVERLSTLGLMREPITVDTFLERHPEYAN